VFVKQLAPVEVAAKSDTATKPATPATKPEPPQAKPEVPKTEEPTAMPSTDSGAEPVVDEHPAYLEGATSSQPLKRRPRKESKRKRSAPIASRQPPGFPRNQPSAATRSFHIPGEVRRLRDVVVP